MDLTMESSIECLRGVGEQRYKCYQRLGLQTVGDLLYHLPRSYVDLRNPFDITTAPVGQLAAIKAVVAQKGAEQRIRKGLSVFKVTAVDQAATLYLTFYNVKYTVSALKEGTEYIFYGRIEGSLLRKEMRSPVVYPATRQGLEPVYPLTAGLTSKLVGFHVGQALQGLRQPDPLDLETLRRYRLLGWTEALHAVHQPKSMEAVAAGRTRLIFDELLCLMLAFERLREGRTEQKNTPMRPRDLSDFFGALAFSPTGAQQRVIREAIADLCTDRPMNRLVQGDVGSGKTLVAAACCLFAARNGYTSVMMAPTELLAEQHYHTMRGLLERFGLRVECLTGGLTPKTKREVRQRLAAGEIDVCVGTHALLTEDTHIPRLGLVITDEQHRFGVAQRLSLTEKGEQANVLVMSATPIPRTLALILYGELDISVIDELPPGRQKIDTYLIDSGKRERAFGYIRKHLDRGLQAYIVCPLVEQGEDQSDERKAAADYAQQIAATSFRGYRVGLLHGRMKAKEKEAVMAQFAAGKIGLLVATTVIEVGIDVPKAVIMMVENAERFGLSQLHQLRGRVGRGEEKSCCILLSDSANEETLARLKLMCRTSDGFQVAAEDLRLRGPGDFFGMRQHGLPALQVADLASDTQMLEQAKQAAQELTREDPLLRRMPLMGKRVDTMLQKMVL